MTQRLRVLVVCVTLTGVSFHQATCAECVVTIEFCPGAQHIGMPAEKEESFSSEKECEEYREKYKHDRCRTMSECTCSEEQSGSQSSDLLSDIDTSGLTIRQTIAYGALQGFLRGLSNVSQDNERAVAEQRRREAWRLAEERRMEAEEKRRREEEEARRKELWRKRSAQVRDGLKDLLGNSGDDSKGMTFDLPDTSAETAPAGGQPEDRSWVELKPLDLNLSDLLSKELGLDKATPEQ